MFRGKCYVIFFFLNCFISCYGAKILIVTDFFPHPTRPFVDNQIEALLNEGHEVHIFAKRPDLNIIQENLPRWKCKVFYGHLPDLDSYNIVYCQLGHLSPAFAEKKVKNNYNWKLAVAFRGYDATAFLKENPQAYDLVFGVGDLFLPVCNFFKKILVDAGCNEKKIIVNHSVIDCDFFSYKVRQLPKKNQIRVVSVGRLVPLKGYEYSIKAVAKLINKGFNIEYTIIGAGSTRRKLNSLIVQLGCANHIHLVGEKSHNEIRDILNTSQIFLLASTTANNITEGIPNALMEGMATGLPVISTKHGGIPELVIDRVSGFLVPEKDVDSLAEKLEFLVQHPELWSIIGYSGRRYVEKEHNAQFIKEKFINLINRLL